MTINNKSSDYSVPVFTLNQYALNQSDAGLSHQ